MIKVNVFHNTQTGVGDPIAVLSFTGRGKAVTITTDDTDVDAILATFVGTSLALPKQGIVPPEPRKEWMEALSSCLPSIPYWFSVVNDESAVQEEVSNDIEEDIEEIDEEDDIDEGEEGGDDSSDGGDAASDGDDIDLS